LDVSGLFSLEGKVARVTGGSRGIGKMIAAGFVAQGAKAYVSSRKADACDAAAAELGPNCSSLPADVSTVAGCEELPAALTAREARLDSLVNNAGLAWGASFEEFPETGWDRVMDLNVKSPFFLNSAGERRRPGRDRTGQRRRAGELEERLTMRDAVIVSPVRTPIGKAWRAASPTESRWRQLVTIDPDYLERLIQYAGFKFKWPGHRGLELRGRNSGGFY